MNGQNNVPINITGDASGVKKASAEAKDSLQDLRKEADKGRDSFREAAKGQELVSVAIRGVTLAAAAGATAIAAYAAVQVAAAAAYLKSAAALGDLAEKHEVAVEQLSVMRLEAIQANTSIEKIGQGYRQLSVRMLEANSGGQQAISLFRALGVEWEDGTGKLRAVDDVMNDVKDRFSQMAEGAGRTGVAAKLLGRGLGDELVPWLIQTREETAKLRTEAEKMGLKISTETARQAKEFEDNLKTLKLSTEGLATSLVNDMLPALVKITEQMRLARQEGGLLYTIQQGLMKGAQYAVGVGDEKQELDGVLAQLQTRYKTMQRLNANAEAGERNEGQRNALQAEINDFERDRDRLASVLAINNPTGYSEVPAKPRKAPAPDVLEKEGRAGAGGRTPRAHDWGEEDRKAALKKLAAQEEGDRAFNRALYGGGNEGVVEAAERTVRDAENMVYTWNEAGERVMVPRKEFEKVKEEGVAAFRELKDTGSDTFKELQSAVEGWGRDTSRALAKMAFDGRMSFSSLGSAARAFGEELLAIQIQKRLMAPMLNEGTRILDNLFNPSAGYGPGTQGGGAFDYNFGGGYTLFHDGGIVGEKRGPKRWVHPAAFDRAPRFHQGGEVPAVLQVGEEVLTRQDPRHRANGGAAMPRIQIINQGAPLAVTDQRMEFDAEGAVVRIFVGQMTRGGPIRDAIERHKQGPR